MTRYYLRDIRTILLNNSPVYPPGHPKAGQNKWTNIFFDYRVDADNVTTLNNSILLYSRTGSAETNTPLETRNFEVYVRRENHNDAIDDAEELYQFLDSYAGGLGDADAIKFRRLVAVQSPQPFQVTGMYEYLMEFQAQLINFDRNTVK